MILQDVAELAYLQLFPHSSDETSATKEEFIATARVLYASMMWVQARNEKNQEGYYNVPSSLLSEVEKDVVNNEIDISDLNILRGLPSEVFIQNIGGLTCECEYIKSTVNTSQLLCDDEALEGYKTYFVVGNRIRFPRGTHKKKLPIIYANSGENVDGVTYIDDVVGGLLRDKLIETYGGKTGKEDETNNSSSNS